MTTTVQGQIVDAALAPAAGLVTLRLVVATDGSRPPALLSGGVSVIAQVEPTVDGSGHWSTPLVSNFDPGLTPSGTYYEVYQQPFGGHATGLTIQVPLTGGPYNVDALVLDAPSPLPPSGLTIAHLNASPAHTAAHIGFTPTGGITATNVQDAIVTAGAGTDYLHTQLAAATVWTINHNRHSYPGGLYVAESTIPPTEILGYDREDPDNDHTILTFPYALSGFVRLK